MPLIRYDTGDIGSIGYEDNKKVLFKVEGRKMDQIYNTKGELVSSFTLTNNMWFFTGILQYQFIQINKNSYKFVLIVSKTFKRENDLILEFKKHLGKDANIYVEYVDDIPLLDSGKRKKVINLNGK